MEIELYLEDMEREKNKIEVVLRHEVVRHKVRLNLDVNVDIDAHSNIDFNINMSLLYRHECS